MGVASVAMIEPIESTVQFIKQDLQFSPHLGGVAWNGTTSGGEPATNTAPVIGARHVFTVTDPRANVTGRFAASSARVPAPGVAGADDGDALPPASTVLEVGKGRVHYYGWLPGLAYFAPAIPVRPADRGGTDKAFTHFVPSNFSAPVLGLVAGAAEAAMVTRHVMCSNHLVHGRVVLATRSASSKTTGECVCLACMHLCQARRGMPARKKKTSCACSPLQRHMWRASWWAIDPR